MLTFELRVHLVCASQVSASEDMERCIKWVPKNLGEDNVTLMRSRKVVAVAAADRDGYDGHTGIDGGDQLD